MLLFTDPEHGCSTLVPLQAFISYELALGLHCIELWLTALMSKALPGLDHDMQ